MRFRPHQPASATQPCEGTGRCAMHPVGNECRVPSRTDHVAHLEAGDQASPLAVEHDGGVLVSRNSGGEPVSVDSLQTPGDDDDGAVTTLNGVHIDGRRATDPCDRKHGNRERTEPTRVAASFKGSRYGLPRHDLRYDVSSPSSVSRSSDSWLSTPLFHTRTDAPGVLTGPPFGSYPSFLSSGSRGCRTSRLPALGYRGWSGSSWRASPWRLCWWSERSPSSAG